MAQQPIDNKQKLINQDGTPTAYFIRLLQERGFSSDDIAAKVAEIAVELADLSLDDLTDVDLITTPPADGDALTYDAGLAQWVPGAGGGGGGGGAPITFAQFRQQSAIGVDGGASVVGWQTRTLNTTLTNTIVGASLSLNRITLNQGVYRVRAAAPTYRSNRSKLRIRDVTNNVTLLVGTNEYANTGDDGVTPEVEGYISLSGTTQIELQHYISNVDATFGLGISAPSSGEPEVYADVVIEQVSGASYSGGGFLSLELTPLPAFQNGWVEYGSGYETLKIWKTGRLVNITGILKDGASSTTAFTLPVGWRPTGLIDGPLTQMLSSNYYTVFPNGEVRFVRGSSSYVAFSISFLVPVVDAYNGGTGGAGVTTGVVFPASPAVAERFYRTDRNIEYFWNGTYWLSTSEYTLDMPYYTDLAAANIGNAGAYYHKPYTGVYDLYITRFGSSIFKTGGTWSITLNVNGSSLATHTYGGANFVWTAQSSALGFFAVNSNAQGCLFQVSVNNFGVASGTMTYRLVG